MNIEYVDGDATKPMSDNPFTIIPHICNDEGKWGAGFVLAISKRWNAPEKYYRSWFRNGLDFALGEVQSIRVNETTVVVNMIAQSGIQSLANPQPLQYESLRMCLRQIAEFAQDFSGEVHMPKIGAGLAGGDWKLIEKIIEEELTDKNIPVFVYTLPK